MLALHPSTSALVGTLLIARPFHGRVPHEARLQYGQQYVEALCASPPDGQAGCLTFAAGDVIAIVREGEPGGWWEGSINGLTGWFPSAFCSAPWTNDAIAGGTIKERIRARMVAAMKQGAAGRQEVSALRLMIAACTYKRKETGAEVLDDVGAIEALSKLAMERKESIAMFEMAGNFAGVEAERFELRLIEEYLPTTVNAGNMAPAVMRAVALYAYEASRPDELSLQQGDVLDVLDATDPSWWMGTLRGQTGMFPSNLVEPRA